MCCRWSRCPSGCSGTNSAHASASSPSIYLVYTHEVIGSIWESYPVGRLLALLARIDRLASQIDVPPTVLGLLGVDYQSKFFGYDLLRLAPGRERAFVATYQTLGYLRDGWLVTLSPKRGVRLRQVDAGAPALTPAHRENLEKEAISLYQVAAQAFRHEMYLDEDSKRRAARLSPPASRAAPISAGTLSPALH